VRNSFFPAPTQLLALLDLGRATINEDPFLDGTNRRRLKSTGVGIDMTGPRDSHFRLVVAHRIGSAPASSDNNRETRAWLQAFKRF
jgi:hypothetical protein